MLKVLTLLSSSLLFISNCAKLKQIVFQCLKSEYTKNESQVQNIQDKV